MYVTDLKTEKQREILRLLGQKFLDIANNDSATDVELTLDLIQAYYLDPLSDEDVFGTEGWEHWLGLN